MIIYGINSSTNIQNIYSGLGLSSDTIYTIGSILLIVFLIFIFVKCVGICVIEMFKPGW